MNYLKLENVSETNIRLMPPYFEHFEKYFHSGLHAEMKESKIVATLLTGHFPPELKEQN